MHFNIILCFWTHLDSCSLLWTHFRGAEILSDERWSNSMKRIANILHNPNTRIKNRKTTHDWIGYVGYDYWCFRRFNDDQRYYHDG